MASRSKTSRSERTANTDEKKNEQQSSKSSRSSRSLEKTQTKSRSSRSTSEPADKPRSPAKSHKKEQEKQEKSPVIRPSPPTEIIATASWTLPAELPEDILHRPLIKAEGAAILHVTNLVEHKWCENQRWDITITATPRKCRLCPGDPRTTVRYDSSLPLYCPADACTLVRLAAGCEAWLGAGCRLITKQGDRSVIKRQCTAPVIPACEINLLWAALRYKVLLLVGMSNKIYIEGKTKVEINGPNCILHLHADCREETAKK